MKREPSKIIEADYRVAGEDRWAPFRRWCAEMSWKYQAKILGEEVASWVWWVKIAYILTMLALVVVVYLFAHGLNRFLWRIFG